MLLIFGIELSESDLREQVDGSLDMPASYETVVARAQLALVSSLLCLCTNFELKFRCEILNVQRKTSCPYVFNCIYCSNSMMLLKMRYECVRSSSTINTCNIKVGLLLLPTSLTLPGEIALSDFRSLIILMLNAGTDITKLLFAVL